MRRIRTAGPDSPVRSAYLSHERRAYRRVPFAIHRVALHEHRVRAKVGDQLVPIPINIDTVNKVYGLSLDESTIERFYESVSEQSISDQTKREMSCSTQSVRDLYEKFFRGYTRKQWGLDPSELAAQVTARIPTRTNHDDRYSAS